MGKILYVDTDGVKSTLPKAVFGYDDFEGGGDAGRVYVGDGITNIPLARLDEIGNTSTTTKQFTTDNTNYAEVEYTSTFTEVPNYRVYILDDVGPISGWFIANTSISGGGDIQSKTYLTPLWVRLKDENTLAILLNEQTTAYIETT